VCRLIVCSADCSLVFVPLLSITPLIVWFAQVILSRRFCIFAPTVLWLFCCTGVDIWCLLSFCLSYHCADKQFRLRTANQFLNQRHGEPAFLMACVHMSAMPLFLTDRCSCSHSRRRWACELGKTTTVRFSCHGYAEHSRKFSRRTRGSAF
jgi:hypothetical protein